jgi:hypothetical protein
LALPDADPSALRRPADSAAEIIKMIIAGLPAQHAVGVSG